MATSMVKLMLFSALILLSLQAVVSVTPLHFQHPLDPLTKQEISLVQTIVQNKYPSSSNRLSFHYIGLDEPEKDAILKWESIKPTVITVPRKALAIVIINSQTHEILIDLKARRIVSDNIHSGNGFPTLSVDEQVVAIELPLKYGPFIESVNKRGLNLSEVVCSTFTMGWFGETKDRRTVRVECFMKESSPNIWVRPISGLTMVVDLELMKIVQYHDGGIIPVPTAANTEYRFSHQNPPFGPRQHSLATHQPQGPGFQINGHSIRYLLLSYVTN